MLEVRARRVKRLLVFAIFLILIKIEVVLEHSASSNGGVARVQADRHEAAARQVFDNHHDDVEV